MKENSDKLDAEAQKLCNENPTPDLCLATYAKNWNSYVVSDLCTRGLAFDLLLYRRED
jgi:hypothetical protein